LRAEPGSLRSADSRSIFLAPAEFKGWLAGIELPSNDTAAFRGAEGAMLGRVGRERMQHQAPRPGDLWLADRRRASAVDGFFLTLEGWGRGQDQLTHRHPLPGAGGQQRVRMGKSPQPGRKSLVEEDRILCRPPREGGDRLRDRESILHAMIELGDQELLLLFGALPLRNVIEDADAATDVAGGIK